jgi:hypothetical protein
LKESNGNKRKNLVLSISSIVLTETTSKPFNGEGFCGARSDGCYNEETMSVPFASEEKVSG